MLNRRYLRIKTMQVLYGYEQTCKAQFEIALDQITARLTPEWDEDPKTPETLEKEIEIGHQLFEQFYLQDHIETPPNTPTNVLREVQAVIIDYHNQIQKEKRSFEKYLQKQTEDIADMYLRCLLFLPTLAQTIRQERELYAQKHLRTPIHEGEFKFEQNQVAKCLQKHDLLNEQATRRHILWETNQEWVRDFYKKVIKQDTVYQQYIQTQQNDWENDKELALYLLKEYLLKHDEARNFLENFDMNWLENRKIVLDMVSKTIQNIPNAQSYHFGLMSLSKNWEDDEQFYHDLFKIYLQKAALYEELIDKKTKNWELERIALLDNILLKMAVVEMTNFPSIPVKVTINEYLDLAKGYSSPKSNKFINGVLDAMAQELTEKGEIKKSARGMMDNK
ncbi:MAG: transcription antitermination factor NusB [Cytophagales bacterium]|nr:MAG: transcription antitermination factor NusB [Cytophagales bacterium]